MVSSEQRVTAVGAGKPIFTLHGEGNQLAGFMAAIHAMISFAADRGDGLRSLRFVTSFACREAARCTASMLV